MKGTRYSRVSIFIALVLVLVMLPLVAYAIQSMPSSGEKQNVKLVGYNDLQHRESLQVTCRGDWAYVGHHGGMNLNPLTGQEEPNGTTILDISDPSNPTIVCHIPSENANCRAVSVVEDYMGSQKDYLIRNHETGTEWKYEIFDITDRANPAKISEITHEGDEPFNFAHKGYWSEESGLFYSASNNATFNKGAHLVIHDLTDPANPQYVSSWWLPGQKAGEDPAKAITLHHPIVDEANDRVYACYLTGGEVVSVDVSDPANPKTAWYIDTEPPGRGTHTAAVINYDDVPNFDDGALPRQYVLVSDEAVGRDVANERRNPVRTKAYMFDVTNADLSNGGTGVPFPVETWQVPDGDYLDRGGRFGPHQFNETIDGKYNTFEDKIAWFAYFNAGVRVVDISDPYNLKEVGYYVPEATEFSRPVTSGQPADVIQINDVDVDYRGLAYCSDRVGNGLYVFEYTKKTSK